MKEYSKIYFFMRVIIKYGGFSMNEEKNKQKKDKKILKQAIAIIAILSTYIMVFLLGRITNMLTLGVKDEVKPGDTVITEPTNNPSVKPTDIPVTTPSPNEKPEEVDGIITLWEGNKNWNQLEEINVFKSKFYKKDYTGKIAPGFLGTYEFDLENNWDKPVTYILSFKEENPDNVNMVYKVMRENEYVLGNENQSVYINGVKLEQITIPGKTKIRYTLKWKWEDTAYDTELGVKDNTQYKLKVNFQATVND